MKEYPISKEMINNFKTYLFSQERSKGTISKYIRDVENFYSSLSSETTKQYFNPLQDEKTVTKEFVIMFKEGLTEKYKVSTVNSILAAINQFFLFAKCEELRVKPLKKQRQIFSRKEKELSKGEYLRLLDVAKSGGNQRISLVMQTICATGIRVSELSYITAEAVYIGQAEVSCKNKQRTIFINGKLKKLLLGYMKSKGIKSGFIFKTRNGKPMNRSNIWSEMKKLCESAGVNPKKVFPHNLRHLFARTFYGLDKDIAKLADLLGHSSIETTRIYIMESGEDHKRKVEKLGLVV